MNDEFPLIIIERCQTCSIFMLSGISALHPEPSPESLQQGSLRCCRGLTKLNWFVVFHISIWGLGALFWGAWTTKRPRGDGMVSPRPTLHG